MDGRSSVDTNQQPSASPDGRGVAFPWRALSRVGEQLGNLRLERLIGEGGMGVLYEARHVVLGRAQAVKLIRPALAHDPEAYARFRREAQIAASLDSDHLVPVREFGTAEDGTPYFVMDLLEGVDLATLLATEGRLEASRATDLILQACRGLRVAHEHSPPIIHRDLKPANLFVCRRDDGNEILKILDFGIAKLLEPHPVDSDTSTGVIQGTPHYMSPEQAAGDGPVDFRTDIYAVGAILYEALLGRKAHPGTAYNEIVSHILLGKPAPIESLRDDLPPMLVAIIRRAMDPDVSNRFQSAAQLAEALTRFRASGANLPPLAPALVATQPPRSPSAPTITALLGDEVSGRIPLSVNSGSAHRVQFRAIGIWACGIGVGLMVLFLAMHGLWSRRLPITISIRIEAVIVPNPAFPLARTPPSPAAPSAAAADLRCRGVTGAEGSPSDSIRIAIGCGRETPPVDPCQTSQ